MLLTIEEVASWSGLSDRAIRNYIRDGFLQGDKSSGKWMFSLEQYGNFLKHPYIAPVIETKNRAFINSMIDSVPDGNSRVCIFLDLLDHRKEAFGFFGHYANDNRDLLDEEVTLSMWPLKGVDGSRIIIQGPHDFIIEMLAKYHEERKSWA